MFAMLELGPFKPSTDPIFSGPLPLCPTAGLGSSVDCIVHVKDTPIRVIHRRSPMVRAKVIHSMKTRWINDHWFHLELTASAGTYIKEFVHGDLGRTVPSVGSLLGCKADIFQLDVLRVHVKSRLLSPDDGESGDGAK